ncbi:cytochrome c oxidase subunit 4 [Sinomonas terrae]|uniref:Cytochrome c oxidase polypeptide 4 n=1 Tax=Sinomonas terrae TaxID=2908838 RepID=A0ABS9U734_9MICC|nr:cytochrome c oxidase subunit 4 [Sinomonas terrae]MCH6472509.1 cytochrome c oxidase subunit 4 [Sinomonas terrae]
MKVERTIFLLLAGFFVIVSTAYGLLTWIEPVGTAGLALCAGLALLIWFYLSQTARRVGMRPEDRENAEVQEGAGEQGHFSPWSWWPICLGASAAVSVLGLAIGFWILFIGAGLALISLVGWVFEYSRGDHAH